MSQLRPAPDVAWVEDPDMALVAVGLIPDGEPIILRDVSALIWLLLDETGSVEEVTDVLAARFCEVDRDEIAASVHAFTEDLLARGLLTPQSPRSPDSTSDTR